MEKPYKYFRIRIKDKIAELIIDREDKSNAFNEAAWEELSEAMLFLDNSKDVRVIILKSESTNFSAGMDLSTLMEIPGKWADKDEARKRRFISGFIKKIQDCISSLEECSKPVIACVRGACIGGALSIVTACDIIYCSRDAYFSIKETELGIVADIGVLQRLPFRMDHGIMAELAYTARKFDSQEACAWGLVNSVYEDPGSMEKEVRKLATSIAEKSPLVIKGIKKLMLYKRDHSVQESLDHVRLWNSAMLISDDLTEAMMAYMEKRKPEFRD